MNQAELISRHLEFAKTVAEDYQKVQKWQASTNPEDKIALIKMAERLHNKGFFNTGYYDRCEAWGSDPGEWIDTSDISNSRPWLRVSEPERDTELMSQVAKDCMQVFERLAFEDLELASKSLEQSGLIIENVRTYDQLAASGMAKDFLKNGEVETAIQSAEADFYKTIGRQKDRISGKYSNKALDDSVARQDPKQLQ